MLMDRTVVMVQYTREVVGKIEVFGSCSCREKSA